MRVKLDEENQKIIICPEFITKTKIVVQSELQNDGTYKEIETTVNYDISCYQNSQESLDDGYEDIDDALIDLFNQEKAKIKNQSIVDITKTSEYKSKIAAVEKTLKINNLQSQIDEIDKKRVRAICEPSVKDPNTGQTWLEYYTLQVQELRKEITNLS